MNHVVVTKTIGNKLFLAPIPTERIHRVLDIGTGTGICMQLALNYYEHRSPLITHVGAIEAADIFPNAEVRKHNNYYSLDCGWQTTVSLEANCSARYWGTT